MLRLLQEVTLASEPGNERLAMEKVAEAVQPLVLPAERLADLKTAVAEVVMNGMEHGNQYQPDSMIEMQVLASTTSIVVRVRDQGGGRTRPLSVLDPPNLEAKLAGLETPRGWGLFLIKNLVDEMHEITEDHSHTVEVVIHYKPIERGKKE